MTATDRLVFQDALGARLSCPWVGTWPPPPRLYLVRNGEGVAVVDPDHQSDDVLTTLVLDHNAHLYTRQSASEIDTPAGDHESWFRGALYQPWRFTDGGRHG